MKEYNLYMQNYTYLQIANLTQQSVEKVKAAIFAYKIKLKKQWTY
jgi:hypothetical protein